VKFGTALRLGRVSNLPTVWTNALAGMVPAQDANSFDVFVIALAASLLYVGGMFLNDACDAEIDARERPERPIPAGLATRREVFAVATTLLAGGVLLAFTRGLGSGIAATLTAGLITLYDVVHKRTLFAPALMAGCRVGVYWMAGFTVGASHYGWLLLGSYVLFTYVMGLTYAAARENSTMLVRVGPLLGLGLPGVVALRSLPLSLAQVLCMLAFIGWTTFCARLVRTRIPTQIRRGIGGLIAGISLVDALWLAPTWPLAALVAVAAFALTLLLQRFVAGT
jgi:hypothetical protein